MFNKFLRFILLSLHVFLMGVVFIFDFKPREQIFIVVLAVISFLIQGPCLPLVYRLQKFIAPKLAPSLCACRMAWLLRWICGKQYSAWALSSYAGRLARDQQHESAIKAYTRALGLDASSATHSANRGATKYNAGHFEDADRDLTRAITLGSVGKL